MRISDWSSDVCSSDLVGRGVEHVPARFEVIEQVGDEIAVVFDDQPSHAIAPWPQRGPASEQDRPCYVGIAWPSVALNAPPPRVPPPSATRATHLPLYPAPASAHTTARLQRTHPSFPH